MSQLFPVEQSEKTSDDYLTPRWVFDTLGLEFDLDVAAPPWDTFVPALRKFTQLDDGLSQSWEGRVWMNPPYSNAAPWVERFLEHNNGISLLPTSRARWFGRLWVSRAALVHPPMMQFHDPGSGELTHIYMPVLFAAFGDECVEALGRLGRVR